MSAALVLDIETVPTEAAMAAPYPKADRSPPSNWKDEEKIAGWYVTDEAKWRSERARECALNPRLGRIVVAGFEVVGEDTHAVNAARTEAHEQFVLSWMWENIAGADGKIVTFNGLTFDVPFFLCRSLVHGIKPTVSIRTVRDWTRRYFYGPHYDVRAVLTGWDNRTTGTLTDWATCFGIECADQTKGSDIYALYQAGDFDAIAEHCRTDVATTAALYEKVSAIYGGVA